MHLVHQGRKDRQSLTLSVAGAHSGAGLVSESLWAAGASPRLLSRIGAIRSLLLVLTAIAVALPTALLPAASIVIASTDRFTRYPFRPDWWALAFLVLLVPAVVGGVALAGGRLRDLVRPTRPDTFAFD